MLFLKILQKRIGNVKANMHNSVYRGNNESGLTALSFLAYVSNGNDACKA